MKARRRGKIVNICSLASRSRPAEHRAVCGEQGRAQDAHARTGGRAARLTTCRSMASRRAFSSTEMNARAHRGCEVLGMGGAAHARGTLGDPPEIAGAAVFLASAAADYVTGHRALRRRRLQRIVLNARAARLSACGFRGRIDALRSGEGQRAFPVCTSTALYRCTPERFQARRKGCAQRLGRVRPSSRHEPSQRRHLRCAGVAVRAGDARHARARRRRRCFAAAPSAPQASPSARSCSTRR